MVLRFRALNTHTHTLTHTHTHIYTHSYTNTHTPTHKHLHTPIHTYTHAHKHTASEPTRGSSMPLPHQTSMTCILLLTRGSRMPLPDQTSCPNSPQSPGKCQASWSPSQTIHIQQKKQKKTKKSVLIAFSKCTHTTIRYTNILTYNIHPYIFISILLLLFIYIIYIHCTNILTSTHTSLHTYVCMYVCMGIYIYSMCVCTYSICINMYI